MGLNHSEDYYIRVLCQKTKIKEFMSTELISIYDDDDVSLAEEKFVEHGIYYLPVITRDQKLKGLITQKYLYKTQSPRKIMNEDVKYDPGKILDGDAFYRREALDNLILDLIMKRNVLTLKPEDTIAEAILSMVGQKLGCIPIVDQNNKLQGILTQQDIMDFMAKVLEE